MTIKLTTEYVASFLGGPSSRMLHASPFREWPFERSVSEDVDIPVIDYECRDKCLEFTADIDDKVQSIFFFSGDDDEPLHASGRGPIELLDLPFETTRQEVHDRLGRPEKSGSKGDHPYLGKRGPWDRFALRDYALHVRFHYSKDSVEQITFMRLDIVPG